MTSLYEEFRPRTVDLVVGQPRALERLNTLRQRGLVGRVFWISAPSGMGKTTLARLIAAEVAEAFATQEIDAQDLTLDCVRLYEDMCRRKPLMGDAHAFIVNEAHGLSKKVLSRLLTVFEEPSVQRNSVWIFTTTPKGQANLFDGAAGDDLEPLLSRAVQLPMASKSDARLDFALEAQRIAAVANLDGQPLDAYLRLFDRCSGNFRKILQEIDSGAMMS